ncbi:TRAP transporter small permease [Desulfonatronovibrio magnus]|uniref:TRAP transporter small permease n=1 Tax=Desulfonatronovibrio magnus TaxID=698827 RepID=UPI0005EB8BDD|nr:TRAP transporter small permease subunit [Desulfonatronovibrio magnus]
MTEFFSRLSNIINKVLVAAGAVLLCLMMGLATLNMVMGFYGQPIRGAYEATGFLGALVAALALAPTQQSGGHITVNLFDRFIPKKFRQILYIISQTILIIFFGLIIRQLILLGSSLKLFGELSESMRIPFYPLVYIVAFGFAALLLTIVVQVFRASK